MAIENVTYNSPDGATMGSATTEKIGFYGSAVTQPALALTTTGLTTLTTTELPAFTTTQVAALNTALGSLDNIITDLKTLGLSA